jgi:hypothetical protein
MAISSNGLAGLKTGVCTSTTRPGGPYEGQMIYETDTDLTYIWGGSAWQQVSGGTAVGNSGWVYITSGSFTTASEFTLDSKFTADYDIYELKVEHLDSATAGETRFQYRTSGSNNSTSNYTHQNTAFTTSTFYDRNTTSTSSAMLTQNVGATGWNWTMTIQNPYSNTKNTLMYSVGGIATGSLPFMGNAAFNTTTRFDGIRIYRTSGTFTGTYQLAGMRKA